MKALSNICLGIAILIPFIMVWNYFQYGTMPWHALAMIPIYLFLYWSFRDTHKQNQEVKELR